MLRTVQFATSAMSKWADTLDRDNIAHGSTQAARQRAIDQLAARVARLEQGLHPGQVTGEPPSRT